jgi:hypothetical protein
MDGTVTRILSRKLAPVALGVVVVVTAASAQQPPLPPPGAQQRNPACLRLEAQLATITRGNVDPQRAEQIKRYEENANRQQAELDRLSARGRELGCEARGFFTLFSGQSPQCGPINHQIQQMRANLDRVLNDLQRLQGNTADREGERRQILVALGQNDCGPQYRDYARTASGGGGGGVGGFFENLFGGGRSGGGEVITTPGGFPGAAGGETYRTICVRTCDGFYFPVSYSTVPANFPQDQQTCQRMCPAAEVQLYSHRNPGEDVAQAVATDGRLYSELPNAFSYRKQFSATCSCRAPGQTWTEALRGVDDPAFERGDIIVTEEQAKILSQPVDAKGKPLPGKAKAPLTKNAPPEIETPAASPAAAPAAEGGKRPVRTVGPPFLPAK